VRTQRNWGPLLEVEPGHAVASLIEDTTDPKGGIA